MCVTNQSWRIDYKNCGLIRALRAETHNNIYFLTYRKYKQTNKLENMTNSTVCGEHKNPPMVSQESSSFKKQ